MSRKNLNGLCAMNPNKLKKVIGHNVYASRMKAKAHTLWP